MNLNWRLPPTWLRFFIIISLVLGVVFRFVNLDKKVYWFDEVINSLHSAGYSKRDWVQQVEAWNGREITVEDLQKYQYPNSEKTSIDVIKALATREPQSPPIYYLLSRWWMQWFGHSVAVARSLSAFVSLFAFPCIYWLCLELFGSSLTGWIAIALLAVSPFHVLYAQEARIYSAWTVTILLSSAALLRAMRLKTKLHWGLYAATLTLALYTFPFSGLVALGHGIYVAITEMVGGVHLTRLRLTKTVTAYLLASLAAIIAFSPWIFCLTKIDSNKMSPWRETEIPFLNLANRWLINLSRIFIDVNGGFYESRTNILLLPLIITLLILVGYSIYFLCRHTPRQVWLFILTSIGVTALALVLPDLILGGRRSSISRYLTPCYLGIQLAVSYLLATQITLTASYVRQKLWQIAAIALISMGVISCSISSQAPYWWNKGEYQNFSRIASIVNQADSPLLLSDAHWGATLNVLCLSHLLEQKVKVQFFANPNYPKINYTFTNGFLFNPDYVLPNTVEKAQKFIKLQSVFKDDYFSLWKLEK